MDLETELSVFRRFSAADVKAWGSLNKPHQMVTELLHKGVLFAKLPFSSGPRIKNRIKAKLLHEAIFSLVNLICTSHDAKKPLLGSEYDDVFAHGIASDALRRVFLRKAWSTKVWEEPYIEHSSFRAAIGMAMIVSALSLNRAIKDRDCDLAVNLCADAFGLLLLDGKVKFQLRNRTAKEIIEALPARVLSSRAKLAVSNRPDQKLRPLWKLHCQKVHESGIPIHTLNDILNVAGYDLAIIKVDARTLKRWAKEDCGLVFKAGRPKGK